jgi:antitoxin (DNA-binding transcriptional repressor) of toxin-antitoxin stability system
MAKLRSLLDSARLVPEDDPNWAKVAIMRTVDIRIADLPRLLDQVAAGEEIVIAHAGQPVARLAPFEPHRAPRAPGLLKGKIWIAEDFDEPLPAQILAAFRGEHP